MKSLPPALQAHLDDGTTTLAWCWRITRADGVTFGFTDHGTVPLLTGTPVRLGAFVGSDVAVGAEAPGGTPR